MAKNKSVAAINISVFLLMIGVGLIVALLPQKIMKLSSSVSDVGLLACAYAIPNLLLQIPIGYLSDRFGFKPFLVGGYLLCGLSGFLYFFADTPNSYFGARVLQGIAEIPIWTLAPALLSIQHTSDKGKFMGIYNASLHCGLTTGGLLSIIIFRIFQGNEPFLLFSVLSIFGGLLTAIFVENPNQDSRNQRTTVNTAGIWPLLVDGTNIFVFFGVTLYGAGYGIFITIIPAFLIHTKEVSQTTIGVFFAVFYIALSLSQLLGGMWSDGKGKKSAMIVGLLIAALGISTFHKYQYHTSIFLFAVASFGLGIFCVSSMVFLNECVPKSSKGTISGIFYFAWGLGYFFGPLLIGIISSTISFNAGFSLFATLIMLQALAISIIMHKSPRALPEIK